MAKFGKLSGMLGQRGYKLRKIKADPNDINQSAIAPTQLPPENLSFQKPITDKEKEAALARFANARKKNK